MAPSKLRKAIGVVKDQTSISIAKVASTNAPDLDVAIVKATSHDEIPIDEKYVYAILHLTSYSRGYVSACVHSLSKRIGKTHNWIVALKALMLIHRLLLDGDPNFEQEILQAMRHGARLLNLSDFRDDSHSNAWDYSAFVRTYGLYLDERLDCSILGKCQFGDKAGKNQNQLPRGHSDFAGSSYRGAYEYSDGHNNDFGRYNDNNGYRPGYNEYESSYGGRSRYGDYDGPRKPEIEEVAKTPPVAVRDMKPDMILDRMPFWQRLLERFLASRPTGAAKNNRLVQVALYLVVKESFQLYKDINDGLAILLDGFFDMEYQDCVTSFDIYSRAAKQIDELAAFYNLCKNIGVCRTSEYPDVQKVSEKLLETLEEFLRDRSASNKNIPKSPEPKRPESPGPRTEEPVEDMNSIKALPAPGDDLPQKEIEQPKLPKAQIEKEVDLLDLSEATISSEDQENKFALALFNGGPSSTSGATKSWETFSTSEGPASSSNGTTSAWQTPLAENGKEGWELALVESASNLSKQENKMPGAFDPLVLDGLYEQAAARQQINPYVQPGSASSVAALPRPGAPAYLALPAPPTQQGVTPVSVPAGGDPFSASLYVPPPSYVQMAEMTKKQQLLVQEQQLWQQYQNNGMQYQNNVMQYPYTGMPYQNNGMPYYNNGTQYRYG